MVRVGAFIGGLGGLIAGGAITPAVIEKALPADALPGLIAVVGILTILGAAMILGCLVGGATIVPSYIKTSRQEQ